MKEPTFMGLPIVVVEEPEWDELCRKAAARNVLQTALDKMRDLGFYAEILDNCGESHELDASTIPLWPVPQNERESP